MTSFNDVMTTF